MFSKEKGPQEMIKRKIASVMFGILSLVTFGVGVQRQIVACSASCDGGSGDAHCGRPCGTQCDCGCVGADCSCTQCPPPPPSDCTDCG